jgi:tRNA threonylcarbamoyladenosine biosynthesis protein TsaB
MITLTIRTDKPESELGLFDDDKELANKHWQAHRELAETIHMQISELLTSRSFELKDLDRIVAFEGPGSFTGLRIGLSVANALAYALGIPIVGGRGEKWIQDGITALQAGKNDTVVQPHYGAPVHISEPKH